MTRGIDAEKVPGPRHVTAFAASAGVCALVWSLARQPATGVDWAVTIGGALSLAAAATLVAATAVTVGHRHGLRWLRRRRRRMAAVPAVAAGLSLLLSIATGWTFAESPPSDADTAACPYPTELRVLAAPARLALATELADGYRAASAESGSGCATVNPYVYAAADPDRDLAAELLRGWSGDALRELGPRPDVWFPESWAQVTRLDTMRDGADTPLVGLSGQQYAFSPLVFTVAEDAHESTPSELNTWPAVLHHAEEAGWGMARPRPGSTLGDLVMVQLYGTGHVAPADLEPRMARTLQQQGYPLGGDDPVTDEHALMCHHAGSPTDGDPVTGLLVTEQAMLLYNRGAYDVPGCQPYRAVQDPDTSPRTGGERLVPLSPPSETYSLDHHVVTLDWEPIAHDQAAAAADFQRWLTGDGAGALLDELRLRGLAEPSHFTGGLPDGDVAARPPEQPVLDRVRVEYQQQRVPGRVLLAVSMGHDRDADQEGATGPPRREQALTGVDGALAVLDDTDDFALWVFPAAEPRLAGFANGDTPIQPRRERALAALADHFDDPAPVPAGPDLYDTIQDGVGLLAEYDDPASRMLIVVTDTAEPALDPALLDELLASDDLPVRVFVVATGEATCELDELETVTGGSGGDCRYADLAELPAELERLMRMVMWSADDAA